MKHYYFAERHGLLVGQYMGNPHLNPSRWCRVIRVQTVPVHTEQVVLDFIPTFIAADNLATGLNLRGE